MMVQRYNRENDKNGSENKRETAAHRVTFLCLRLPELYSAHLMTT